MTKTTFRERLEIEYANAQYKYNELMAVADLQDDDDVWTDLSNKADEYWKIAKSCEDLLNAMNNELI